MAEDRLDRLFRMQRESDRFWVDLSRLKVDEDYLNSQLTKRILEIHEEATELKNKLGLSDHKLAGRSDIYDVTMQIVDILKYTIGAANFVGLTPDQVFDAFVEKTDRLHVQWNARREEFKRDTKIVCVDIDNVLADYNRALTNFYFSTGIEPVKGNEGEYSFHKRYGISLARKEELYKRFVLEGGLRDLKLVDGAKNAIGELSLHYTIVFVTARPAWTFSRIYEDTQIWKAAHGWSKFMTIFDKDKADAVQSLHPASVVAFVEDRDKHAVELSHVCNSVLLMDRPYNQSFPDKDFPQIKRVFGWESILKELIIEEE